MSKKKLKKRLKALEKIIKSNSLTLVDKDNPNISFKYEVTNGNLELSSTTTETATTTHSLETIPVNPN